MSEQHYAPPRADLKPDTAEIQSLIWVLVDTRPWVRFIAIMIFLAGLTMIGMAFFIMVNSNSLMQANRGAGALVGIIYLVFALVYFFAGSHLFRFASCITWAEQSQSLRDIERAFQYQKSFWKLVGILTIVFTVFMLIGLLGTLLPSSHF